MNAGDVQSVSQLTDAIKYTLNGDFGDVWVSGEVSGVSKPQSGHVYFTLKDSTAQISTIVWRSYAAKMIFEIEEGMQVICRGYLDVYPQRGNYQLIARTLAPVGQGSLQLAFRKLHDQLRKEGLFHDSHKKPIPRIPRRIALITSPTGAAVHDFLQVVNRRWPHLEILLVPVLVQGPEAPKQITAAISKFKNRSKLKFRPDVMVVTRGGGSIEDLWAFNDEKVVRAIHAADVPVISAVGHEIDVSLSDLVADVRALTPTEAGEKIVPDITEVQSFLKSCKTRLNSSLNSTLSQTRKQLVALTMRPGLRQPLNITRQLGLQMDSLEAKLTQLSGRKFEITRQQLKYHLESLTRALKNSIPKSIQQLKHITESPAIRNPNQMIDSRKSGLKQLRDGLVSQIQKQTERKRQSLKILESKLSAFNPENVLQRGYSLTVDGTGKPVVDCNNVQNGDTIRTWLANGSVTSKVESVEQDSKYTNNG